MSRFEIKINFTDYFIIDNETGDKWLFKQDIAEVMNQQDEKIKELENKVFELQSKLNMKEHEPVFCKLADRECEYLGKVEKLEKEKNQLAVEELGKLYDIRICNLRNYIDKRINELRGNKC